MIAVVWSKLDSRLASLPVVLAGPILRRVEPGSVSVWIACRDAFKARLFIAPATDSNGAPLDIHDPTNQLQSSPVTQQAVALGKHLHVLVLTADLTAAGMTLQPATIYQYSIQFDLYIQDDVPSGNPDLVQWLDATGVLSNAGGVGTISYGTFTGPTFMLPAPQVVHLKFAHASCRKPHGGQVDALAAVHHVLETSHASTTDRPQQLFLTGDQVYVDDVDDGLLYMLADAAATLLEWDQVEALPGLPNGAPPLPGERQDTVLGAGFTSDAAKSHLLGLGEFYAMYLFGWSDVIWPPVGSYAPFSEVYPNTSATRTVYYVVPSPDGYGQTESVVKPSKEAEAYEKTTEVLKRFVRDQSLVRKALANIPSYMILDDHEVTDDWFLTRQWCVDTLATGSLGRRIMQNALCAYAVFQHWGNVPAAFVSSTPGRAVLDMLAGLGAAGADWEAPGNTLLPTLGPMTGYLYGGQLGSGFNWHYAIDFTAYRLIALDTRTHRAFEDNWEPPQLVNAAHLALQLDPTSQTNFAVVLSATPVIGYQVAEWGIAAKTALASPANPVVERMMWSDDLVTDTNTYRQEDLYFRNVTGVRARGDALAANDFEAWGYNEHALQEVLMRMAQYRHVFILSGDVHYSFTNLIEYWNDRGGQHSFSTFVQMCSSAARNSAGLTYKCEHVATSSVIFGTYPDFSRYGWSNLNGEFFVSDSGLGQFLGVSAPEWQYRVEFAVDFRDNGARGLPNPTMVISDAYGLTQAAGNRLWPGQCYVVGVDNVGFVSFAPQQNDYLLVHELHWSLVDGAPIDAPPPAAHTRHTRLLSNGPTPAKPWP